MRLNIYLFSFIMSAVLIAAKPAKSNHQDAVLGGSEVVETGFKYVKYPTYENGTLSSLNNRPLQALNIGTTFRRPRDAGNLRFLAGIYTEEGSLNALGRQLSENEPHCFVNPKGSEQFNQEDPQIDRHSCTLENIEGTEHLKKTESLSEYRTKLELECGKWNRVEITCHNPSNGEAAEMKLGQFEKILSKHFRLGNVAMDTPLIAGQNKGFPIEEPVTPAQIMSGGLVFKLIDKTGMAFVEKKDEFDPSRYEQYFQSGTVLSARPQNFDADMVIAVLPEQGQVLNSAPTSLDINGMNLSDVFVGYSKRNLGKGEQYRKAYLLVAGTKNIHGVDTEVRVHWSDPQHSHVTYEGMWVIPGREVIDNTIILK